MATDEFVSHIRKKIFSFASLTTLKRSEFWYPHMVEHALYYEDYKQRVLEGEPPFTTEDEFNRRRAIIVEVIELERMRLRKRHAALQANPEKEGTTLKLKKLEHAQFILRYTKDKLEHWYMKRYMLERFAEASHPENPQILEIAKAKLAEQEKAKVNQAVDTSHLKPYKGGGGL